MEWMLIFNNAIELDLAWFIMKNITSSADVALYLEFFYLCCIFFLKFMCFCI